MSSAPQKGQLRLFPIADALSYYQSYVAGAKQVAPVQVAQTPGMGPMSMAAAKHPQPNESFNYPALVGLPNGAPLPYHVGNSKYLAHLNAMKQQTLSAAKWKPPGTKHTSSPQHVFTPKQSDLKAIGVRNSNAVMSGSPVSVGVEDAQLLRQTPASNTIAHANDDSRSAVSAQETSRVHILRNQTFISTRKRCNQCITCLQGACQTCTNCINKKKRKRSCENSVPCLGEIIKFTERVFDDSDFQVLQNALSPSGSGGDAKPASFDIVYKRQEELKILKKSIVAEEKALEYLLKALNST